MIAAAFPTVTVSLVYMIWDACRRRVSRSLRAAGLSTISEKLAHRLACLTLVMKPLPGRRG
jgi:hypothetical protein